MPVDPAGALAGAWAEQDKVMAAAANRAVKLKWIFMSVIDLVREKVLPNENTLAAAFYVSPKPQRRAGSGFAL